VPVRVEGEQVVVEEGEGRRTHFPLRSGGIPPLEGNYDAILEVAWNGCFLKAEEISTRPLKAWLGCQEAAVRLVVNRNPEGEPLDSAPFILDGIEVVVRPTLNRSAGERAWRLASLLPCREVRVYSLDSERSWKVFSQVPGVRNFMDMKQEEVPEPQVHDRFNEMAAALPSQPTACPYGTRFSGTRKRNEDWKGFRMENLST